MQQYPVKVPLITNAAVTGAAVAWPGGKGFFSVCGTLTGCTVALQFLGPDGTTWLAVPSVSTVATAIGIAFALPQCMIKATLTGGSPAGVYAAADWIPE